MHEDLQMCLQMAEEQMQDGIKHLTDELSKVRAGKASPALVSHVTVDYYGTMSPLSQVANVNTPDAKTLSIQPWEKTMLEPIEKAILAANIGITPQNNGETIRLFIPPLTEERRKDLVKQVKQIAEDTKVGIRGARKSANDEVKNMEKEVSEISEDMVKDAEAAIQNLTNKYVGKIDEYANTKEQEIMTV